MGSKKFPHVFSPINIRGIDFKNRIVLAPPSPNLASLDGKVTPEFIDWFRMFARGGVTTLYVGNSSIDITECKDEAFQLDLSSDDGIRELARYADMAKEYDCHASLEINHNGENTAFETVGHAPYSASPIISASEMRRAKELGREPIPAIEMTHEKIKETVNKYGDAAARMQRAGMDIVLVHGGHGNLISQFTSPLYNHRTDEYGGSTENRARFAIEVCDNIREKCGEHFVIEFRISADEIAEEGMHFEETLELIGLLKDHIDILHVSAGLHSDFNMKYYRNWCQNYLMERGYNVHFAADIKKRYPDLLVTTVGSITNIELAEEILANGWADFVAMCRPLMADPDMPNKYAHDMPEEHRPCLRCDTCTKHLMIPKPIFCAINPVSGMTSVLNKDGVIPPAIKKKKVAVIGAGPGGITALQTLADRGHDVTLYEMTDKFAGTLNKAMAPSYKIDLKEYVKWLDYQGRKYAQYPNVRVLMNTKATKEMLDAENYDAIIIAIGADPIVPRVPGIDGPNVCWSPDAEEGSIEVGDNIVIIGGGINGIESAIQFACYEHKKVTVVEMFDKKKTVFNWMTKGAGTQFREFQARLEEGGVDLKCGHQLTAVEDGKVIAKNLETGEDVEIPCDNVLLAVGMRPRAAEADSLRHCAPETEVHIIGDAKQARNIYDAVNEAFRICIHI